MMTDRELLEAYISSVRVLNVPRLEDLPYATSPPIQFTYQSTANLNLGSYTWVDNPSALTPNRPILSNALYFFRTITLAADIEELDFESNITTTPDFYTYLESGAQAPLFREPIHMVKFLEDFTYKFLWKRNQDNNRLYAGFRGVINQGVALIGKASITLTAIISAQEIVDENFIKLFVTKPYPDINNVK